MKVVAGDWYGLIATLRNTANTEDSVKVLLDFVVDSLDDIDGLGGIEELDDGLEEVVEFSKLLHLRSDEIIHAVMHRPLPGVIPLPDERGDD